MVRKAREPAALAFSGELAQDQSLRNGRATVFPRILRASNVGELGKSRVGKSRDGVADQSACLDWVFVVSNKTRRLRHHP